MGKALDVSVQNAALTQFATANELYITTAQPSGANAGALRTSAIALALNAAVTLAAGDFTQAAGDTSGRKVTVAAKTVTVATAGTGTHVVVANTTTGFVGVTTMASTAANAGDTINLSAFKLEVADPT